MKNGLLLLVPIAIAIAAGAWLFKSKPGGYSPYSVVDAAELLKVLDDPARPGPFSFANVRKLDYVVDADGALVATAAWTDPAIKEPQAEDVNLIATITVLKSEAAAERTYAESVTKDTGGFTKLQTKNVPVNLIAEAHDLIVIRRPPKVTLYLLKARYGNYLVRIVSRVAPGANFETEEAFLAKMLRLDAHLAGTLRAATEPS